MYKDILIPVDLEHENSWRVALPVALELHQAFGSRLHIMTVLPDLGMTAVGVYLPEGFERKHLEDTNKRLHEFVRQHLPVAEDKVQHIVCEGVVYKEIIRMAEQVGADLILMAAHRPEIKDYLIGANAERVIRHYSGSVLVVRNEAASE